MSPDLQTLSAERDIVQVITALFTGTDDRDWARVRCCFADEVVFDMTSLAGGAPATLTPKAITDGWDAGLAMLQAVHHQAGNYSVDVLGDSADAFCYGIAYHYKPTQSGRNTRIFVGSYDFHLVRVAREWKINRFRFNLKFVDGNMRLEQEP